MRLVILTGASGSGKTALAEAIGSKHPGIAEVVHFDRIGVPTAEERQVWGSDEEWQRAMTKMWMARIAAMRLERPVLFEGQMRLAFIREALQSTGLVDARILLVDCDDATRTDRLVTDRCQRELATETMMIWAAYLRREAQELGCEVLDTSALSIEASVALVCAYLTA
jgi:dephospho-CoA kinase